MMRAAAAIRIGLMAGALGVWTASVLHALQVPAQDAAQPPAAAPAEAEFPPGAGSEMFVNACSICHAAALAVETRQSRDNWRKVLIDMEDRGAVLSKEDTTIIVDYLTEHFGTELNVNKARAKEIGSFLTLSAEEAAAIVRFRGSTGPFKSWDDLTKVPGLDIKKIEGKKGSVTF
jgi:competence ComEA-like helix-hairpin-helix protein